MIKVGLDEYSTQPGTLDICFSDIYYDDEAMQDTGTVEPNTRIFGEWALSVPYTANHSIYYAIPKRIYKTKPRGEIWKEKCRWTPARYL